MRRAALLVAGLLLWAAPAHAALIGLDSSDYPQLQVTLVTERATSRPPRLLENGRPVAGLEARNLADEKSIVLAVDRSRSMEGSAIQEAIASARAYVRAKARGDRIAIVAFGSRAVLLSPFSGATIDTDIALRTLGVDPTPGTALNDAVVLASERLAGEPRGGRVLVVVTDGNDVSSSATEAEAAAAARRAGVTVYAIGIEGPQFSPDELRRLAHDTGGSYHGAAGAAALGSAYARVSEDLRRTWLLSWPTAARPGDRLELRAGSSSLAAALPGSSPRSSRPVGPSGAYTSPGSALAIGLAVGLLLLLAFAAAASAGRGSWVRRRLAPHVGPRASAARSRKDRLAAGSIVLRATERALGHLRPWRKAHRLLERADVPLRTAELFWICFGTGLFFAFVAAVSGQPTVLGLAAFAIGGFCPYGFVALRARRRLRAFDNQLPDLLLTLAASLKAGHSFKQGIQSVVEEGLPPASEELRRALTEVGLGRPLEEALRDMAERIGSENLDFVVSAITIQGQVGGSLAGLFDMVAEAVRQRQQFARKIRGLTAMGRASAYVLAAIPFFLAGVLTLLNPDYMGSLWNTSAGHMLIAVGLTMMAIGSMLLKRIVSFKG